MTKKDDAYTKAEKFDQKDLLNKCCPYGEKDKNKSSKATRTSKDTDKR